MTEKDLTNLKERLQCPFCGYTFASKEAAATCDTCIFRKRCSLIMCPRCGHNSLQVLGKTGNS